MTKGRRNGNSKRNPEHGATSPVANGNENGNGNGHSDALGDPEFFLVPLLATDPLPYLFDSDGNPVNAEGEVIARGGNGLPKAIKRLQEEARPKRDSLDG